jgi:hypothetical protein
MDDFRQMIVSEEGCFNYTFERKYYRKRDYSKEDIFVKRSLRKSEYKTGYRGLYISKFAMERLRNEAASLEIVHQYANVPVPRLYESFEYNGAYYIAMEYVEGAGMSSLSKDEQEVVAREIEIHLSTIHALTSNEIGISSNTIIPPYRIMEKIENNKWNLSTEDLGVVHVYCHMDLSQ